MQTLLQTHFLQPKETAQDIWRQILGPEDPNPGKIDGKALSNRKRLIKAFSEIGKIGRREVKLTAEDIAALRLAMSCAYGTPLKMQPSGNGKPRMPFIGRHGLPWEYDVMADQERKAREAQKDQEKIDAAARQRQLQGTLAEQIDDEDDGEALEVVRG
jgi:hypothetical protein